MAQKMSAIWEALAQFTSVQQAMTSRQIWWCDQVSGTFHLTIMYFARRQQCAQLCSCASGCQHAAVQFWTSGRPSLQWH